MKVTQKKKKRVINPENFSLIKNAISIKGDI